MAFYLIEAKLSQDGVKALLATPHNRRESAAKLVEAIGGTLHQYFFAFGEYDIVLLVEAPDHASVTAGSLVALGRRGRHQDDGPHDRGRGLGGNEEGRRDRRQVCPAEPVSRRGGPRELIGVGVRRLWFRSRGLGAVGPPARLPMRSSKAWGGAVATEWLMTPFTARRPCSERPITAPGTISLASR